ncbi:hypothetical protein ACIGG5_34070 [Streptomyces sp. NPDC085463]|uniref:hypothetical protein n=1 Tax=Streptomyces sp. NPDC085463 TaxID=3365724 RepID=UPI0037D0E62A
MLAVAGALVAASAPAAPLSSAQHLDAPRASAAALEATSDAVLRAAVAGSA